MNAMPPEQNLSTSTSFDPQSRPGLAAVTLSALADAPFWVSWQTQLRADSDKKPTKIPYSPCTGRKAKANEPATWGTREQAEAHAPKLLKPFGAGGIGLEFAPLDDGRHIGGVDLDSCRNPETGAIETWAQAWIARLDSYTEVSPSGTGVKVFYLYSIADRERLRESLGRNAKGELKHSALWARRSDDDHPPAIEMHLSSRYFAVTDAILPGSTDELREVPTETLLQLIRVDGPAFIASQATASTDDEADAAIAAQEHGPAPVQRKRDMLGRDQSRSAKAFGVGAKAKRAGANFEGMCEAIRLNPVTASWYEEKGVANGSRELRNIWDKVPDVASRQAAMGRDPPPRAMAHRLHGRRGLSLRAGDRHAVLGLHRGPHLSARLQG